VIIFSSYTQVYSVICVISDTASNSIRVIKTVPFLFSAYTKAFFFVYPFLVSSYTLVHTVIYDSG